MSVCRTIWLACLLVALTGCGGNKFPTAYVSGTVLCEGSPVSNGTITFNPIAEGSSSEPGKSATGKVGADGKFELTTYRAGDGAIVGMHDVFYTPPSADEGEEGDEEGEDGGNVKPVAPAAPVKRPPGKTKLLPCQFGGTARVGVVEGRNDVKVELKSWLPKVNKGDDDSGSERGR